MKGPLLSPNVHVSAARTARTGAEAPIPAPRSRRSPPPPALAAAVVLGVLSSSVSAQAAGARAVHAPPMPSASALSAGLDATVLISEVPGAPSHAVPGLVGVNHGGGPASGMPHIEVSPAGRWAARWPTDQAFLPQAGHVPHVLLRDGVALLLEGDPAPLGGRADTISSSLGVNDLGHVSIGLEDASVGTQRALFHDGTAWSELATPAGAVPGTASDTWSGQSFRGPRLMFNGTAAYYGALDGGLFQQALVLGNQLLLRSGFHIPGNQAGGASEPFWILDDSAATSGAFALAPTGATWAARVLLGSQLTGSHSALLIDGDVVLEQGEPVAIGNSGVITAFDDVAVDATGRWLATGHAQVPGGPETTWAVSHGAILAVSGGLVVPGAIERWDHDGYFETGCALNSVGDWVLTGNTDAGANFDEVLVFNGDVVLCRESDAVDLDGNGLLDDDVQVAGFLPRGVRLTDDGQIFSMVRLRDGQGADLGAALLHIDAGDLVGRGPWVDLGSGLAGTNGVPVLDLSGSLLGGLPVFFGLQGALENSVAWLILSVAELNAPFKGGTLVPDPVVGVSFPIPTGPVGGFDVPVQWPPFPGGFSTWMQMWIADPGGPLGFSATNAWRGDVP